MKRQPSRLLTRAVQALALRVLRIQICSRQICLWILSFRLQGCHHKGGPETEVEQRRSSCRGGAKDKSAGSGFGITPKGKNQGWFLQSISPSGARTRLTIRRDSDTLQFVFDPQ